MKNRLSSENFGAVRASREMPDFSNQSPYRDESLRRQKYGAIQPMADPDRERGLLARLFLRR